jgi:hypothetical protein
MFLASFPPDRLRYFGAAEEEGGIGQSRNLAAAELNRRSWA